MPRCTGPKGSRSAGLQLWEQEVLDVDTDLAEFWEGLSLGERKKLLKVDKKMLFATIRSRYCSRCFGLFVMRYDELRSAAQLDCPACAEFYSGLAAQDSSGALTLEDDVLRGTPWAVFAEAKARERERELQFMTGDICGSGWTKRPGQTMCALHTSPVPYEALTEYWNNLPAEHRSALFSMREEDFVAELDAHMKYQLKICKDCRGNVMRAYRELKPGRKTVPGAAPVSSDLALAPSLEVCDDYSLTVADGLVSVDGKAAASFFERAEEVEECKGAVGDADEDYDNPDLIRHAETPELAREALVDSVVLIFKSQVEVAFREQTAGHNALLLFVHLTLEMMEAQLMNAFKELQAKQAETELLEELAEDKKKQESKKAKKKARRAKTKVGGEEGGPTAPAPADSPPRPASPPCASCTALQTAPSSPKSQHPQAQHAAAASPCLPRSKSGEQPLRDSSSGDHPSSRSLSPGSLGQSRGDGGTAKKVGLWPD